MLTEEKVHELLARLRSKEILEVLVEKKDFMLFRSVLMKQEDKQYFVGKAQKGGNVFYSYKRHDEKG